MLRLIKVFLHDVVAWVLLFLLGGTLLFGIATLFNRYERLDHYERLMYRLELDIQRLENQLEEKKEWASRLKTDPTAWEQVGREKMNFLASDEVLIRFVPE